MPEHETARAEPLAPPPHMATSNAQPNQPAIAAVAAAKPALEVWQRGPVPGFARELQPIAHALMQVSEEVELHASGLSHEELWARPYEVASVGFHLLHIAGSTDRLLAYARSETLTPDQIAVARSESAALATDVTALELVQRTQRALQQSLEHVRTTPLDALYDVRYIGRARIETTTLGLLFHTAEHATRHAGQLVTTAKVVRGLSLQHAVETTR